MLSTSTWICDNLWLYHVSCIDWTYCIHKTLKCFKYTKRKHLGKEADDIFYFHLKNTSAASNHKKCSCSYKLPEIKLNVSGFLNNTNIADMHRHAFKCSSLKLMPLFLGGRCGKTIGTNFKSILKGFFFGQITFRKNICNKKDSKINVFFYEIKKRDWCITKEVKD